MGQRKPAAVDPCMTTEKRVSTILLVAGWTSLAHPQYDDVGSD